MTARRLKLADVWGQCGPHESRLKVLRVIERENRPVTNGEIAALAGLTQRAVRSHVDRLVDSGVLVHSTINVKAGLGTKDIRIVWRSDAHLPCEVEDVLDAGWWPAADPVVCHAIRGMVLVGRMGGGARAAA
ncbi:winged helix-turn-helix transcriptional regulator [Paraburkholderia sp. BR10936]|uniref:winged helix-turn-helix transcriptional regulator n=1 Tax=Paraburkholderia sp. BR10936 TaxID=3236993 RepID=UPI0034D174C5